MVHAPIKSIAAAALVTLPLLSGMGSTAFASSEDAAFWTNPVIKNYGKIHPLHNVALTPDKNTTYKVVFDATKGDEKDGVNTALWHVARAVNVFGYAGVDQEHRDFAVVIHGPATPVVMTNEAYKQKFNKDNPNDKLIQELKQAGVKLYVCGQAVADNDIAYDAVNPAITMSLSALADLPILVLQL